MGAAIQTVGKPSTYLHPDFFKGRQKNTREIVISDKNPLLAEVLCAQLAQPGLFECSSVPIETELVPVVRDRKPDLLIVDPLHLGLTQSHDITDFGHAIRLASVKTRIVAYSFRVTASMIRATLEAGFHGCLSKTSSLSHFEVAVAAVLEGGMFFDRSFGEKLRPMLNDNGDTGDILSEREKEVLVKIARGLGTKQIAYDLKISTKTVDTYKSRAVQKLGLSDRAKLVEYVLDNGWMS